MIHLPIRLFVLNKLTTSQAVRYGHRRAVKMLLHKGAHPNVKDSSDKPALYYAAWAERSAMLLLLFKKDAGLKIKNHGAGTALAAAVKKRFYAAIKLLLAHSAKVDY